MALAQHYSRELTFAIAVLLIIVLFRPVAGSDTQAVPFFACSFYSAAQWMGRGGLVVQCGRLLVRIDTRTRSWHQS
jgi:hypothetical protein